MKFSLRPASLAAALLALGCSTHVIENTGGGPTGTGGSGTGCTGAACACGPTALVQDLTQQSVNKIDLVLAVDNSAAMAYKQQLLSQVVPELLAGLLNPPCVDATTGVIVGGAPPSPVQACPGGEVRQFPPILDMHVGLVSSSLGSFGADGCPDHPPSSCVPSAMANSTSNDDHGHLVTRTDPCGSTDVPTYQGLGFLSWDPAQTQTPPGTSDLAALASNAYNLVVGDGELGCGFESQNESWYRFLVDPAPYQSIALVNNQVQVQGIDSALLAQRKAFLRPDSLLLIVNLTDETDTSLKEYSSYPLFAAPELHLPHPSSGCHFGTSSPTPADPCCYSCGQSPPSGCAADPACSASPSYSGADEDPTLRAFGLISHKARYGIEFFYPPSRYVSALTASTVTDVNGKTVPNPIYTNLDPAHYTGAVRDPSMVFYAPITGVPWQLLARQRNGVPDLIHGVSSVNPSDVGGFRTAQELNLTDSHGNDLWDDIAGDPEHWVPALSPFMVESTVPRSGTDPITGAAISPVTTPNGLGSQVGGGLLNDHERTIKQPADSIEYACIFPLAQPLDCTQPGLACECPSSSGQATDNPVCNGTMQVNARAYPGIKHLAIARGLGENGIPGSICAKQITDPSAPDYGYRPSISAILRTVTGRLAVDRGDCLAQPLPGAGAGCKVIEARNTGSNGCTCDPNAGRAPVPMTDACLLGVVQGAPQVSQQGLGCFCEITEATGAALTSCQTEPSPTGTGWCYADATTNPASAPVEAKCPSGAQRSVRFSGAAAPEPGSTIFLACQ
jgi:hypothetical protein